MTKTNSQLPLILALAVVLVVPAIAQTTQDTASVPPSVASQDSATAPATEAESSSKAAASTTSDPDLAARQPLEPETREGFWGRMNPFARKKYVQRQVEPIRGRVDELDGLTAANAKAIKDVDARAQDGIQKASAKAGEADQHATAAAHRADQANQTALEASKHLDSVQQAVGNIDQYRQADQVELLFPGGQSVLSAKSRQALDDLASNLQDQRGYVIAVQGFSPAAGQAGIQSSQVMANTVVRYLVQKHQVPVYRIYVLGLGNAQLPSQAKPTRRSRVEVSLLKNDAGQLTTAQQTMPAGKSSSASRP